MSYLKPLATTLFLSTLFTMEISFNATPPAQAQDNDCVIFALAGASRMEREQVLEVTNFMDGPALGEQDIVNGVQVLGLGGLDGGHTRTFYSREQLENYLRSNDNTEYIVGWRPNREGGIGHVVNARVFNGRIRYIDNQAECESPNPAAEPPTNEGVVYYAWLTDSNVQTRMEDIRFLFGGLSLEDNSNSSLVPRSIDAPLRNPSFSNFTANCRDINLFDRSNSSRSSQFSLSAECKDSQGNFQGTAIILDGHIVNNSGALSWQSGGGFGGSVRNCRIDVGVYTVLTCDAGDGRGSWRRAAINLDAEIANRNGRLISDI